MSIVLTYNGYTLEEVKGSLQSQIGKRIIKFDTPSMWVQYINYISDGKTE